MQTPTTSDDEHSLKENEKCGMDRAITYIHKTYLKRVIINDMKLSSLCRFSARQCAN